MGMMNKFGRLQGVRPQTHVDGVAVSDLVAEYGSPLFVFSERTLVNRYRELHEAFARRYPRVRIAWSYKTNYLEGICRLFHKQGAWAEVVSPFEWDKAIHAGMTPDQIHWNGPYKPDDALERAIAGGTILHLDGLDELTRVERVSHKLGVRARVAVRVNMAIDGQSPWSRFGLNLESGQAKDGIRRLVAGGKVDLVGLHAHIGTFIQETEAYGQSASKLAKLANEIKADHGVVLSFIDVGGGFASKNTLKSQYLSGDQASPPFSRYADAICDGLAELDYPARELPTLVLETGRALVDEAGYLISTVQANKRLPDGRRALVIDAGVNLLFTSYWYKHDVVPAQEFGGLLEPTVMYGPLCMNIDVMRDTMQFPAMSSGDRLVFRNVGAYNVTQWQQFITLRPAIVMVGMDGRVAPLRRAEALEDFTRIESVPEWLR
jgi:diaminopimelate decarboxylase